MNTSPLPWRVDHSSAPEIRYGEGRAGQFICRSQTGHAPTDEANMDLICHAVNAYALVGELIKRLEIVDAYIRTKDASFGEEHRECANCELLTRVREVMK